MAEEVLVECPECGEEVNRTAPSREKDERTGKHVYRGNKIYCQNRDCQKYREILAQRPITLCGHPEGSRARVPGYEYISYCKLCGVLSPDHQEGWKSRVPPWKSSA